MARSYFFTAPARALSKPPVRFTMARMFFRSMTLRSSSGGSGYSRSAEKETPFWECLEPERWVWMSMTGNLERATMVSGTRRMLFGAYAEISKGLRSGFASSADIGDLKIPGFAATPASRPILYNQARRSITFVSFNHGSQESVNRRTVRHSFRAE